MSLPVPRIKVICPTCGKPFSTESNKSGRRTYCSHTCYAKGNITLPEKTSNCKRCGKTFTFRKNPNDPPQVFCSKACKNLRFRIQKGTCESCGKSFDKYFKPGDTPHRFCSQVCHLNWKRAKPVYNRCVICGNDFRINGSSQGGTNKHKKTCSHSCLQVLRSRNFVNNPSGLELRFKSELEKLGHPFVHQFVVGPFVVDFADPKTKLILQVDGCYWHGHLKCFPIPGPQQVKGINKDKARTAYFKRLGWEVIHFWECEINRDINKCMKVVSSKL